MKTASTFREKRRAAIRTSSGGRLTLSMTDLRVGDEVKPRHGDTWGEWTLDAKRLVLAYRAYEEDGFFYGYEVDLEKCTTSEAVLDWIFQIEGHRYDSAGLVAALDDLLHPQRTLCSCGLNGAPGKKLNATRHLRARIGRAPEMEAKRCI